MTKIKICGLSRTEDIIAVNQARPDYIGFVFAKSRRQVTQEKAEQLKKLLHPSIKAVGVFVNEEIDGIEKICMNNTIDIIQLHGDEDENYIKELRKSCSLPVIKAVRVRNPEDIKRAESFACDYLLLDTYTDHEYGGSGISFDWSMVKKISKPYFLAGGIHSGNILDAIRICNPYCIDVSSGVETDGFKDTNKIIKIVTKIRSEG